MERRKMTHEWNSRGGQHCWLVVVLFICVLRFPSAGSQSVTLAWDANPAVSGYRLYWGPAARKYTNSVNVGNLTTATLSNLVDGATYFFAVTDYNSSGLESDYFNEVIYTNRVQQPSLVSASMQVSANQCQFTLSSSSGQTVVVQASTNLVNWSPVITNVLTNSTMSCTFSDIRPTNVCRFFRAVVR
jgi:hypothetical protein